MYVVCLACLSFLYMFYLCVMFFSACMGCLLLFKCCMMTNIICICVASCCVLYMSCLFSNFVLVIRLHYYYIAERCSSAATFLLCYYEVFWIMSYRVVCVFIVLWYVLRMSVVCCMCSNVSYCVWWFRCNSVWFIEFEIVLWVI